MSTYDRVKELLVKNPKLRDSDKQLIWEIWFGEREMIMVSKFDFMKLESAESITRARRKVQEIHPELRASKEVEAEREWKEDLKGNFIFI